MPRVTIERYLPGRPLPPYSYVPGVNPHPIRDPRGHMHGREPTPPQPLDPARPRDSPDYLYGIDLFNHGFAWEAHEAWESLWRVANRRGPIAAWLKCLIKLAAAHVKLREGSTDGVRRHAKRALELLAEVRNHSTAQAATVVDGAHHAVDAYCGIRFMAIEAAASELMAAFKEGGRVRDAQWTNEEKLMLS